MKKIFEILKMDTEIDCLGEFNIKKTVCRKYCALRLRCAVLKQGRSAIEQPEELSEDQDIPLRLQ
jgi:hypothetical protein